MGSWVRLSGWSRTRWSESPAERAVAALCSSARACGLPTRSSCRHEKRTPQSCIQMAARLPREGSAGVSERCWGVRQGAVTRVMTHSAAAAERESLLLHAASRRVGAVLVRSPRRGRRMARRRRVRHFEDVMRHIHLANTPWSCTAHTTSVETLAATARRSLSWPTAR